MIRIVTIIILTLTMSCFWTNIVGQAIYQESRHNIPTITGINGDNVYLDNDQEIELAGLTDQSKQLVFIVNHAQEDSIGLDPGLTYLGKTRANGLMHLLNQAQIQNIYSILFRRTVLTIRPLVKKIHVPIKHFDPGEVDYLTEKYFKNDKGNAVVIGTKSAVIDLLYEISPSFNQTIPFENNPYDYIFIVEMNISTEPIIHCFKY